MFQKSISALKNSKVKPRIILTWGCFYSLMPPLTTPIFLKIIACYLVSVELSWEVSDFNTCDRSRASSWVCAHHRNMMEENLGTCEFATSCSFKCNLPKNYRTDCVYLWLGDIFILTWLWTNLEMNFYVQAWTGKVDRTDRAFPEGDLSKIPVLYLEEQRDYEYQRCMSCTWFSGPGLDEPQSTYTAGTNRRPPVFSRNIGKCRPSWTDKNSLPLFPAVCGMVASGMASFVYRFSALYVHVHTYRHVWALKRR